MSEASPPHVPEKRTVVTITAGGRPSVAALGRRPTGKATVHARVRADSDAEKKATSVPPLYARVSKAVCESVCVCGGRSLVCAFP